MRIIKEYNERRDEIIDTAQGLFYTRGYEKCTVNDILREVNIAKGTFYHYFRSKEEVLDAVVSRYADIISDKVGEIVRLNHISPEEKLLRAFMAMQIASQVEVNTLDDMHKAENALLHQKTLNRIVTVMVPLLVEIIEEGVEKKIWRCRYPLEYMKIFLVSSLALTDEGIFETDGDSQMDIMVALISLLEKMLDAPEDSFIKIFMERND